MRKNRQITEDTRLLSYAQIATMLSCSVSQVFSLRERGRLPIKPLRIGGMVRYPRASVERWISEGCPTDFKTSKR